MTTLISAAVHLPRPSLLERTLLIVAAAVRDAAWHHMTVRTARLARTAARYEHAERARDLGARVHARLLP